MTSEWPNKKLKKKMDFGISLSLINTVNFVFKEGIKRVILFILNWTENGYGSSLGKFISSP